MRQNPLEFIDFYKADHRRQYPEGTTSVYANFTPRKSRIPGVDNIVFFGMQYMLQEYLVDQFNNEFFNMPQQVVVDDYQELMDHGLGSDVITTEHIRDLHKLGHLPVLIKSLDEGVLVPMQTPVMTIVNTHPDFAWLTNYLETLISCELWKLSTSATTAHNFRMTFERACHRTGGNPAFVDFQGHDFSMRGMSGVDDARKSGAAHLLSFLGTDTVPAIRWLMNYYGARFEDGLIGGSVAATEHSVACASAAVYGQEPTSSIDPIAAGELMSLIRLLTINYPKGIVSVVADSYDFWRFVSDLLPRVRETVMLRDGKLVIRPDSGTPYLILCGDPSASSEFERKGLIECLWDIFGGTTNAKGFRELDSHIGAIYGDSIDWATQQAILEGLERKGFASTNVVLGLGSFTYQYVTRDTYGFVTKATHCIVNGQEIDIFKSPKTGSWKKSHRGRLCVNEDMTVRQECTAEGEADGLLRPVYKNSQLLRTTSLLEIRNRLKLQRQRLLHAL